MRMSEPANGEWVLPLPPARDLLPVTHVHGSLLARRDPWTWVTGKRSRAGGRGRTHSPFAGSDILIAFKQRPPRPRVQRAARLPQTRESYGRLHPPQATFR